MRYTSTFQGCNDPIINNNWFCRYVGCVGYVTHNRTLPPLHLKSKSIRLNIFLNQKRNTEQIKRDNGILEQMGEESCGFITYRCWPQAGVHKTCQRHGGRDKPVPKTLSSGHRAWRCAADMKCKLPTRNGLAGVEWTWVWRADAPHDRLMASSALAPRTMREG